MQKQFFSSKNALFVPSWEAYLVISHTWSDPFLNFQRGTIAKYNFWDNFDAQLFRAQFNYPKFKIVYEFWPFAIFILPTIMMAAVIFFFNQSEPSKCFCLHSNCMKIKSRSNFNEIQNIFPFCEIQNIPMDAIALMLICVEISEMHACCLQAVEFCQKLKSDMLLLQSYGECVDLCWWWWKEK